MKTYISFLLLVLLNFSFAQIKLEVGEFNQIESFDKLTIKLIKSDQQYIEVSGPKSDQVEFVNKNKKLKLRMKTDEFLKGNDVRILVYYKDLNLISAQEGSFITSDETLVFDELEIVAKEGSFIVVNLDLKKLLIKTHTGGRIETMGNSIDQLVISNSGGNYDGQSLKTERTEVTVNAGGEAKVFAIESVKAKTRAGGNIHIFGGAQVTQESIAGGTVHIH